MEFTSVRLYQSFYAIRLTQLSQFKPKMNTPRAKLSASFTQVRSRVTEALINPEDMGELEVTKARKEAQLYKRKYEETAAELTRLRAEKSAHEKAVIKSPLKRLPIKKSSENTNPNIPRRLPTQPSEQAPDLLRNILEERNRELQTLRSQVSSLQLRVMTMQNKHHDEVQQLQERYREQLRESRKKVKTLSAELLYLRYNTKFESMDFTLSDDQTSSES